MKFGRLFLNTVLPAVCLSPFLSTLADAQKVSPVLANSTNSSQTYSAKDVSYPLWKPSVPFPTAQEMPFLRVVTHVTIQRTTPSGFFYLHESGIALHKGVLHAIFANGPWERDFTDELVRESRSTDNGMTWSEPTVLAPGGPDMAHNHPVLISHGGKLWAFVTRFESKVPSMEGFVWNEDKDVYESVGILVKNFMAFDPPKKMKDGNWILGGEKDFSGPPRVLISKGDDFTKWEAVDLATPEGTFRGPDTTLFVTDDEIVSVSRNSAYNAALVGVSKDFGRTWSRLKVSNFPMAASKPIGGILSTGQRYLVSNNAEEGRKLLSIAVSKPGETELSAIWKIQHAAYPRRRSPVLTASRDDATQWIYPAALEFNGSLYVIYDVGKEDCELSIIPLAALQVN